MLLTETYALLSKVSSQLSFGTSLPGAPKGLSFSPSLHCIHPSPFPNLLGRGVCTNTVFKQIPGGTEMSNNFGHSVSCHLVPYQATEKKHIYLDAVNPHPWVLCVYRLKIIHQHTQNCLPLMNPFSVANGVLV